MNVLLLPGYACTSVIWESVRDDLASDHSLTLVDWPRLLTPGFHSIADFSRWLSASLDLSSFDFVISHSLGGLVALDLVTSGAASSSRLVLVESFLQAPAPFFRNLVLVEDSFHAIAIRRMLSEESPFFSPILQRSLQDVEMTGCVPSLAHAIYALYGDRGSGQPSLVAEALSWPPSLASSIDLAVIPNACHFPMLENPVATLLALRRILSSPAA